jgi:unsaturated rhamnogalacturonyl hydrolase
MRSHSFLIHAAALIICVGILASAQSTPKPADVLSAIMRANAYYMSNATLQSDDCNWTQATYFDGATSLISATQDPAALAFVSKWAESHYFTCDRGNAKWDWSADRQACGHAYAELHSMAPADRKLALAVTLSKQISASTSGSGAFDATAWWWVDALFMALPTWLRYSNLTGDARIRTAARANFDWTLSGGAVRPDGGRGLWSVDDSLFYRDASFFNATSPNGNRVFWSRGNGWAAAALAQTIELLQSSRADDAWLAQLSALLTALSSRLVALQGADGFWRSGLLDTDQFSNPESTGTALFVFALARGVRLGVLNADSVLPAIFRAWTALERVALTPSGRIGWCQDVGKAPDAATADSTSDFCVGVFLKAGVEVWRLLSE